MNHLSLISVIVITYNSSKYIIETLESVKTQTYSNIELIISDDCSTDRTVIICKEWIKKNNNSFTSVKIIDSKNNTGIPSNCNRGIKAAQGEWIKLIAGDDLLMPNCISDYVNSISLKKDFLVGRMQCFTTDEKGNKIKRGLFPIEQNLPFFQLSPLKQHKYLLIKSFNFAPSVFLKKELFEKYGYFKEEYKYLEDLPYWLHLTSHGIKLHFIDIQTVLYRTEHESAVFSNKNFYNIRFRTCLSDFQKKEIYPQIPFWNICYYQGELINKLEFFLITKLFKNKKNRFTILINCFSKYFNLQKICNKISL